MRVRRVRRPTSYLRSRPTVGRIAYFETADNRWVIRNLNTGITQVFADFGSSQTAGISGNDRKYELEGQSPATFSPSGEALALPTASGPVVIDTESGATQVVTGMEQAVGWMDDDRLVGRASAAAPTATTDTGLDVMVWSRTTGAATGLGSIQFGESPNGPVFLDGQWWGSVRGDGTLWLSLSGKSDQMPWLVGVSLPGLKPVGLDGEPTSMLTWIELNRLSNVGAAVNGEVLAWSHDAPVVFSEGQVRPTVALGPSAPTTVIDHAIGVHRIIWASDALNGKPSGSFFGTSNAWWTWWWKEIALVVAAAVLLVWWRGRRRTSMAE